MDERRQEVGGREGVRRGGSGSSRRGVAVDEVEDRGGLDVQVAVVEVSEQRVVCIVWVEIARFVSSINNKLCWKRHTAWLLIQPNLPLLVRLDQLSSDV